MQHAETVRQCDEGHQEEEGAGEVTVHAPTAERVHNTRHAHCHHWPLPPPRSAQGSRTGELKTPRERHQLTPLSSDKPRTIQHSSERLRYGLPITGSCRGRPRSAASTACKLELVLRPHGHQDMTESPPPRHMQPAWGRRWYTARSVTIPLPTP